MPNLCKLDKDLLLVGAFKIPIPLKWQLEISSELEEKAGDLILLRKN